MYLDKREGLSEDKAPALLKVYYRRAGGGWRTGQAKWIQQINFTHFHTDVNIIKALWM